MSYREATLDAVPVALTVNGETLRLLVEPTRTLLTVLRDDLGLTGAKRGCDQGLCGSCTVLCDDQPIRACLSLVAAEDGRSIVTIEGLAENGRLSAVQAAFVETGAVQCGFCIPGMIVAAQALLRDTPHPTIDQIRHALSGHLCRCSGYVKIVDAIARAGAVS